MAFVFICSLSVFAQQTSLEQGEEATYNTSVDLFDDGLYAAARVGFDELLTSDLPTQSFLKEQSVPFPLRAHLRDLRVPLLDLRVCRGEFPPQRLRLNLPPRQLSFHTLDRSRRLLEPTVSV